MKLKWTLQALFQKEDYPNFVTKYFIVEHSCDLLIFFAEFINNSWNYSKAYCLLKHEQQTENCLEFPLLT